MRARYVVACSLVVAAAGTVSVVAAATPTLDGAAEVGRAARRVDPPAYPDLTPEQRAAQDLFVVVNTWRRQAGLPELAWDDRVAAAAHAHSADMAARRQMTHRGSDGSNAGDRLRAAGFTWSAWGENIAAGFTAPDPVLAAWLASPGHRAVLVGAYGSIGLAAVAGGNGVVYWTLVVASG